MFINREAIRIPKKRIDITKNWCRKRLIEPKKCDPRSFRVKTIKKGVKITICCPDGEWDSKKKQCKVGTVAQSLMKRKTARGTCPRM